jgi:spore germination cell wall hydrolase CwlJ-like protein
MVASRIRARRGRAGRSSARFWLSTFCVALMPTSIGYQDIAALLTRQPASHGTHAHLIASPFGTIDPATFTYGVRPIGTAIPQPPLVQRVNFDPSALDARAWLGDRPLSVPQAAPTDYPTVNRRLKGDRQPLSNNAPAPAAPQNLQQLQPINAVPATQPAPVPSVPPAPPAPKPDTHAQAQPPAPSVAQFDADVPAAGEIGPADGQGYTLAAIAFTDDDSGDRSAQIYLGSGAIESLSGLQQWAPGAEPIMVTPAMESALDGSAGDDADAAPTGKDGASRLQSPALRLGLSGATRAKAEKCLADAVYFEARGESLRGQEAVAQVVMNRVFSGYYPNNVCGVVYQNASHYLACQFTFACEHKDLSRIDEPDMWAQAKRIAKEELDGKIWLPDIGHATHYHAYWVHPSWVHEMTRLDKLGVHTFYRPRAWGNGDNEPVWGTPPNASSADPNADAAKGPEAQAAPEPAKSASTARL